MKFKQGIQQRISWFFGGFVLVLALSYSAASIVVAYIIEDEVLNRLVSLEIERMQRHYQKTGSIAPPSAAYFTVYDSINSAPSEIARVAKANAAGEVFSASGRHYHIRNLRIGPSLPSYANAILVADVTELLAVRNLPINIVVFLAGLIVLAITIALVGALVIAQRISSPIVALAEKVDGYEYTGLLKNGKSTGAKAKEDLVVPLDNEVDYLTLTIESTFKKLQAVIERESQFNRDVSHELRTPLTEIINTLALTEQQRLNAKAVSQLACSAYKMKNIVDVLLALARAESTKTDTFPLLPLIEECVLNQYAKIKENNFKIECDLSALTVVGN
ncbi:sensor histidine kinase [Marinagarivorans cellulosilyticus]|uniref:histidine kinase n=1 Tax=Marinagarivorans cellulosilyticus TaxID=2721545 RepID=A0AAN1WKD6_9GAMM|nr:histidine kinase dimerization/phospho-acceptor domain-containing protein [Marinagarivorans cellulosilyticus]BCD99189.1 hypothetical protein MARGE09_P3390 [Marinagarivorans cellulosilyticus]